MSRGRKKSPLVDAAGKVLHLPQNEKGQFDTPRSKMGREHALSILNDDQYRENLLKRMRAGEAGAVEVWVWRIGYGEPQKDDTDEAAMRARMAAVRETVLGLLRDHPEKAHALSAVVEGASRILPRPILVARTGEPDA